MRGRTFKDAFIIADEMQNSTPNQMKMLLTRVGEGSKMIVTGDLMQHDRKYADNGLKDIANKLENKNYKRIKVIKFTTEDVERSQIVKDILHIYGDVN
jgi:phosphate starvation-inducible PhoH-like protein